MESQPTIAPEFDTNVKAHIEAEFIDLSRNYVPLLRAFITTSAPGNPQIVLIEFKKRFDAIYTLSSSKKELKQEVVGKVKSWLDKPLRCTNKTIKEGIELFEEYKNELFRQNVIKMG